MCRYVITVKHSLRSCTLRGAYIINMFFSPLLGLKKGWIQQPCIRFAHAPFGGRILSMNFLCTFQYFKRCHKTPSTAQRKREWIRLSWLLEVKSPLPPPCAPWCHLPTPPATWFRCKWKCKLPANGVQTVSSRFAPVRRFVSFVRTSAPFVRSPWELFFYLTPGIGR